MQIKKGNVKQKIKNSAKELFFNMPYKDVSMRDVAQKSDMTVGNIYRYYENKEILFDDIVKKCYDEVMTITKINNFAKSFTQKNVVINKKKVYKSSRFRNFLLDLIAKSVSNNAVELYILINSSEGSKYEKINEQLLVVIKESMMDVVENLDEHRANIYSKTALTTILFILKEYIHNKETLKKEISSFLENFFKIFE